MILYINSDRQITAYNKTLTPSQERAEVAKGGAMIFSGEFDFFMGEDILGKQKAFYLTEDNIIRIEYTDIPPKEPTYEERIESKADYLVMMQEEGGTV